MAEMLDLTCNILSLGGGVVDGERIYPHRDTIPSGGMREYSANLSSIILVMETCAGSGGRLVYALYHLIIRHHIYFTRGG